jgi:hypothetical protein
MAEAKIEIKVGAVTFSGEGEGKWLSEQLDKVLEKIPELANVSPSGGSGDIGNAGGGSGTSHTGSSAAGGTLANFLKSKNATTNQRLKFLASAIWVTDAKKKDQLTTNDVTQALTDAKQVPLSNPSQSLNDNIKQGYCHKTGKQFYVTDEGRTALGS